MIVFVLPADEDQLRAKGYDKTPDFILQVPVGKCLDMHLCIEGSWGLVWVLVCFVFLHVIISKCFQSRLSL